jgi:hypothetical protein
MSPPFSLSDSELDILMRLAEPIDPQRRDSFLREVAFEAEHLNVHGDGTIHRIARGLQRRYLGPTMPTMSKYH